MEEAGRITPLLFPGAPSPLPGWRGLAAGGQAAAATRPAAAAERPAAATAAATAAAGWQVWPSMVKVNTSAGKADAAARRRAPRKMGLRRVTPLSCVTFRCRACGEFILRRYGWRPSGLKAMAREIMEEYEGLCPHCGAELQEPRIPDNLSVNEQE